MRIGVDRFKQALRRTNDIDKAIDLGIAIEVILLHSFDPTDRGELKYRSSLRGAMFLGGDKPDRVKTFNLLKDAYDLRSKAVHAGTLATKKKKPTPPKQTLELAARALSDHIETYPAFRK